MKLTTKPYKGMRDFYPRDKRIQKYMFEIMRQTCESFGYEEYDAPILEPTELYLQKGNEEIIKEQTYTFEDRGGRSVTLRTEMTPSVSRMVANKRQELIYPLRWYSIPNLWRYERPQRGRQREFWQLNVDIFGVEGLEADLEIIQVTDAIFKNFGAKPAMYTINVNSRKLMDFVLSDYLQLNTEQAITMGRLIDKMKKMPVETFFETCNEVFNDAQRKDGALSKLKTLLSVKTLNNLPSELVTHPSVTNLQKLMKALKAGGITSAIFDITLMRGFDYYTDIVFEVFDTNPDNNRSMFGGGRYDGLVGAFGVDPVPTVGLGMGDVTLMNFLESNKLLPDLTPKTDIYMVLIGDVYQQASAVAAQLRDKGVKVAIDISGRRPDKQTKAADKTGLQNVLFVGEQELKDQKYTLKDLKTGKEQKLTVDEIVKQF